MTRNRGRPWMGEKERKKKFLAASPGPSGGIIPIALKLRELCVLNMTGYRNSLNVPGTLLLTLTLTEIYVKTMLHCLNPILLVSL
jgi:hypothetical protein